MDLLRLPNEMLEKIAEAMDSATRVAFAMSHERFFASSFHLTRRMKLTCIPTVVFQFIEKYGAVVEDLDLSGTTISWSTIETVLMNCPNLRGLNLVNTLVCYSELLQVLKHLPHLETLKFSLLSFDRDDTSGFRLSKLKHLYVETKPSTDAFDLIVDSLNNSDIIESVYVNLIGRAPVRRLNFDHPPICLLSSSWNTLNTFVCSVNLANTFGVHVTLLEQVFATKLTAQVVEWIEEDKLCYVYENGNFNGANPIVVNSNVQLMNRFHQIKISEANMNMKLPPYPWKALRALCVKSSIRLQPMSVNQISPYLSSALVELDLSDYHGDYVEAHCIEIIEAIPSLETLAVPLCFMRAGVPVNRQRWYPAPLIWHDDARGAPREESTPFCRALQTTKLRKLVVKGTTSGNRACFSGCETPITVSNFPQLEYLPHLRELTLTQLTVQRNAYRNFANPNVHTVRLCLNRQSDMSGLYGFVLRCPMLQNFKYDVLNLSLDNAYLWETLFAIKKLRQLCVGSAEGSCDMTLVRPHVLKLLQNLEVLHIHAHATTAHTLYEGLRDQLNTERCFENRRGSVFFKWQLNLRSLMFMEIPNYIPGRSLCCLENMIGAVESVGWLTE